MIHQLCAVRCIVPNLPTSFHAEKFVPLLDTRRTLSVHASMPRVRNVQRTVNPIFSVISGVRRIVHVLLAKVLGDCECLWEHAGWPERSTHSSWACRCFRTWLALDSWTWMLGWCWEMGFQARRAPLLIPQVQTASNGAQNACIEQSEALPAYSKFKSCSACCFCFSHLTPTSSRLCCASCE